MIDEAINEAPLKILIVDDDEVARYMYRRYLMLASRRYEIYEATDRATGINLSQTLNPDCILLDLCFPDDYGFEILQDLLASHVASNDQPKARVIVLSALRQKLLQEGALSMGACKYLVKDHTTPEILHQAIQDAMSVALSFLTPSSSLDTSPQLGAPPGLLPDS